MGLDASVHCNCYETGNLKEEPPYPDLVFVAADGSLDFQSTDGEVLGALAEWLFNRACAHRRGTLLHHPIGNIAMVAMLRAELAREPDKFPVMLKQVLYNGIHCGDYLSLEDVDLLRNELVCLNKFVSADPTHTEDIEAFRRKMFELAEASRQVGKPISF